MNYWLFLLPFLSAIAGWFIAWMGLHSLFNSPKLHLRFLVELSKLIPTLFANSGQLEEKFSDPHLIRSSAPLIEKHVDEFLRVRLQQEMPFITPFIGEKTIGTLKNLFMQELETLFPEVMKGFLTQIRNNNSSNHLTNEQLVKFSPDKFRKILSDSLSTDLVKIQWIAAGLGFLFGVLEAVILMLFL